MTTKKNLSVPVAADGVPIVVQPQHLDKTRELPACEPFAQENSGSERENGLRGPAQAAPSEIVEDDVTVPVQSSIESTLTFEVLRRQSTEKDEDEDEDDRNR
jgi:hypothetical protein